jgi:hypothetical protein
LILNPFLPNRGIFDITSVLIVTGLNSLLLSIKFYQQDYEQDELITLKDHVFVEDSVNSIVLFSVIL